MADPGNIDYTSHSAFSPNQQTPSLSSGRHPTFKGIRLRSGKWVSEIREPRKTTRIWLGTYPTPEMAAAAYDVAALALKGPDAVVNFPNSYEMPASPSSVDIRAAAGRAAAARAPRSASALDLDIRVDGSDESGRVFMDEDEIFDMPNIIRGMAEGMLVDPSRLPLYDSPSPDDFNDDNLWNYPKY